MIWARVWALGFWAFSSGASLLALIYLAGFVQNRYVFSTIDSGLQIPTHEAVLVNLALLGLFGLQHSGMARRAFKRLLPEPLERSVYLLATSAVLAIIFFKWEPMPETIWFTQTRRPFQALSLFGAFMVVWSALSQGALHFFGFHQTWAYMHGRPYLPPPFKATGFYRYSRHPMMIGTLLFLWSTNDMTQGHLLFASVMTSYVVLAVRWEERDLERLHGAAYTGYRDRVRRFI